MKKLTRLGRYLVGKPRAVALFPWQETRPAQDVFTDANWAGCKASRKSTSGGAILLGSHVVRTWSKTQNTIAQSSAESELLAIVRAATEALGMMSLAADLGINLTARIHVDASAALGILERRGVGRVRHLDVGALWLQEQALRKAVEFVKVKGTSNPADLMTKHLGREAVEQYIEALNMDCREGHADTAVKLHSAMRKDPRPHHQQRQQQQQQQQTTRQQAVPEHDDYNNHTDVLKLQLGAGQESRQWALNGSYSVGSLGAGPGSQQWGLKDSTDASSSRGPSACNSSALGALSSAKEGIRSAAEGASGRQLHSSTGRGSRAGWYDQQPGVMVGHFKGARALRSPCLAGVPWGRVIYRETRDSQTDELVEAIYPRQDQVSAREANRLLTRVTDLRVEVHFDDGSCQEHVKAVRWADLEFAGTSEESLTAESAIREPTMSGDYERRPDEGRWRHGRRAASLSSESVARRSNVCTGTLRSLTRTRGREEMGSDIRDVSLLERSILESKVTGQEHRRGGSGALPRVIEQTYRECPRGVPGALPRQIEQTETIISIEKRCKTHDHLTQVISDKKLSNIERQIQIQQHLIRNLHSGSLECNRSVYSSEQRLRRQDTSERADTERCSHAHSLCSHVHFPIAILLSVDRAPSAESR
jgi:hypothetical protein